MIFPYPLPWWEPFADDSEQVMWLEGIIGSTTLFSFPTTAWRSSKEPGALSAGLLPQVFLLFALGARDAHFSMATRGKPHPFPAILHDVFLMLADPRWKHSCDNVWMSLLQKLQWGS